tara:strand:+ start:825 stop:1055 length:231 start_codon:yes stop_codon:yes gene_type:complete
MHFRDIDIVVKAREELPKNLKDYLDYHLVRPVNDVLVVLISDQDTDRAAASLRVNCFKSRKIIETRYSNFHPVDTV